MSPAPDFLKDDPINPVRQKVNDYSEDRFENIDLADYDEVKEVVGETEGLKPDELEIPTWGENKLPWFQHLMPEKSIDNAGRGIDDRESERYELAHFILSVNAVNFYFHGEEGAARHGDFEGAEAMQAKLMEVSEEEGPLDGQFWQEKTEKEIQNMFDLDVGLEMNEERAELLKDVGEGLDQYDGNFLRLIDEAKNTPYTENGEGVADLTAESMPEAFGQDEFDKRTQLNIGMLYGRAQDSDWFDLDQADRLTVYADYMIPVKMNEMGLIDAPDNPGEIDEEIEEEYRNATILQADRVAEAIKEIYEEESEEYTEKFEQTLPMRLDGFFWTGGRELHHDTDSGYSRHQFKTTDY